MPAPEQLKRQEQYVEEFDKALAAAAANPTPEPEPEPPAPAPEPASPATPNNEDDIWKQRYLSLQGVYNSQVPTLQKQVSDLTAMVSSLKEAQAARAPEPPPPDNSLVTEKDVQAFGDDLVDMVRRVTKEQTRAYEAEIAALKQKLQAAEQNVGQVVETQVQDRRQGFFAKLDGALPTWEAIQATPEAQAFLRTRIPGSTSTWNDVLVGASQRLDADAALEVFGTMLAANPKLNPNQPAQPQRREQARSELERQVAPQRSAAGAPTQPAAGRTYTMKEYSDESMRVVRLMQAGKEKEAQALEAELNAALTEGRLKP